MHSKRNIRHRSATEGDLSNSTGTTVTPRNASGAGPMCLSPASPPDRRRWFILTVLCMSLLIIVIDNTIVNVALPSLVRQLGASVSQLQWVVDAYTLVFAGPPASGRDARRPLRPPPGLDPRAGGVRCRVGHGRRSRPASDSWSAPERSWEAPPRSSCPPPCRS